MLKREGHKCYKGMEMEECCKSRIEEAVRNRTYIIVLIISIALMIIALTVKTASDAEFVGQVSFASTITSIVLSVIAIWMSITGERSTNEIRNKVTDAVASLMTTTDSSKRLTEELECMLNNQSKQYEILLEKMQNNIDNSEGIKETLYEVKSAFGSLSVSQELGEENVDPAGILSNVLDCIRNKEIIIRIFETIDYVMDKTPTPVNDVDAFLQRTTELSGFTRGYVLGIVYTCAKNGLLLEKEEYITVKEKYLKLFEGEE